MSSGQISVEIAVKGADKLASEGNKAKTAIKGIGDSSSTSKPKVDQMGQSLDKAGTKATGAGSKLKSFGSGLGNLVTGIGGVTTAAWALFNSYDNLEKVQMAAEKAAQKEVAMKLKLTNAIQKLNDLKLKEADQTQKVADAESALAKAREDGDPEKIRTAEEKLADAREALAKTSREIPDQEALIAKVREDVALATENAKIKSDDLKESQAQFYTGLLPLVGVLGTSVKSLFSFGKGTEAAGKGADVLAKGAPKAASGITGVGRAGKLAQLMLGPVGIILLGVGTLLTMVATNAFGIRDAFNAFGKAIGDTFPFLRPLLDVIKGIAGALGLLGPESEKAQAGLGKAFGDLWTQIQTFGGQIIGKLTEIGGGFKVLADQLIAGDWQGAFNTIKGGFDQFMGGLKEAARFGKDAIVDIFKLMGIDIVPVINNLLPMLQERFTFIIDTLGEALKQLLQGNIAGAFQTITQPIIDFFVTESPKWAESFKEAFFATLKWVQDDVWPFIQDISQLILDWFAEQGPIWNEEIKKAFFATLMWVKDDVYPGLVAAAAFVISWIQEQAPIWAEEIKRAFFATLHWITDDVAPYLLSLGAAVIAWIQENAPGWGEWIKTKLLELAHWVVTDVGPALASLGSAIIKYVQDNAPIWGEWIKTKLLELLHWVVTDVAPGLASLGSAIIKYVQDEAPGWGEWIKTNFLNLVHWVVSDVGPALASLGSAIIAYVKDNAPGWGAWIKERFLDLVHWIVNDVAPKLESLGSAAIAWIKEKAPEWGAQIVTSTLAGMVWIGEQVAKAFEGFMKAADEWAKGDAGPKSIGATAADQIWKGLQDAWASLTSGFSSLGEMLFGGPQEAQAKGEAPQIIDPAAFQDQLRDLQLLATSTVDRIRIEFGRIVEAVTTAFNQALSNATGVLGMLIQRVTTTATTIGSTVSIVARDFTTHFNTATQNAAGTLNALSAHVLGKLREIASSSQIVATQFTTNFNTATQNAAGSLNQLRSHTTSTMNSIASSSSTATKAVQTLINTINTLKPKTVTITAEVIGLDKVTALKNAINSLQNKTVTTTHNVVTRYSTVYGASGGAFVASSPTKVGPMHISEFGQRELVTVTPLETPGGQPLSGTTRSVVQAGPGRVAQASAGGGGSRTIRAVQPQVIILELGGRELKRYINENLFEGSDSLA